MDVEPGVQKLALEVLRNEIRSSTSSMTSVPKPLKFLRPRYMYIKQFYREGTRMPAELKHEVADVLSVLAMTMAEEGSRDCLAFKLEAWQAGGKDLGAWGHQYVRALAGEIGQEYTARVTADVPRDVGELVELVDEIVPFNMRHNAEVEAVDLLMEVQQLDKLVSGGKDRGGFIDEENYSRVCLYLLRFADYISDEDDLRQLLRVTYEIYTRQKQWPDALRVALRTYMQIPGAGDEAGGNDGDDGMGDADSDGGCGQNLGLQRVKAALDGCEDPLVRKQMAYIIGSHRAFAFTYESDPALDRDDDDEINEIVSGTSLWESFQGLARDLSVEEAKTPEDIYKSHLSETAPTSSRKVDGAHIESARQNLATTFVNAFVNAGFQKDALMTPEGSKWLYKNKEHGMMSAAASLGMVLLWNVDEGLSQIDKFLYSGESNIKAGALLALGICNCGVRDECDAGMGLLPEHLEDKEDKVVRMAAAVGLGLAYAGNPREEVAEALTPIVADTSDTASMEVVSLAALALGISFVGTADDDVSTCLLQRLMEANDGELDQSCARLLCVALGLLYLGKQEGADAMMEAIKAVRPGDEKHNLVKFLEVVMETCAHAGTGNVLVIQKMLHLCAEHLVPAADVKSGSDAAAQEGKDEAAKDASEKKDEQAKKPHFAKHQSAAVLGIALVSMGEGVGKQMAERTYQHLLQYGELPVRRAVPLAIALAHVSDPDYAVIDTLGRLTHDQDAETAQSAILALGISGAGTNNSRIAGMLRQLASFYVKEASHLFVVRIAQGLLHMGKGLMTLQPFHSDRLLLSHTSLSGLLTVLFCCLDLKNTLLSKFHFLLYTLVTAMRPRMLITLDEEMNPLPVTVRVGQSVDTVGQAGRPKTITGFQTHETPVLLSFGERAELAQPEYEQLSNVLEGFVVLKKKPEGWEKREKKEQKRKAAAAAAAAAAASSATTK